MATEVEAKLEAPEGVVLPDFADGVIADDTVTLTATYWDTAELRLLAWGHTLRYRTASDDSESGWTVKIGENTGDVFRRQEVNVPGEAQAPPAGVRSLVRVFVGRDPLVPVAELTTERRRVRVQCAADTTVEVTDDCVTSVVGGQPGASFREFEVELLDGSEDAITDVVAQLVAAGAQPSSAGPKVGRVVTSTASPGLQRRPLSPKATLAELVTESITDGALRLLARDTGLRIDDEPEDVHQSRVATRRLRSDLKSLAPWLQETRVEAVREELRWLGRLLGAVRDFDVLTKRLRAAAADLPAVDAGTVEALVARLGSQREQRLIELRDVLDGDRYLDLVTDLVAMARTPPIAEGVDADDRASAPARRLVSKAWKRVHGRVKKLPSKPEEEALHEIRRRAKRARYAAELVAPVVDERRALAFARRLADVQDSLGELQDAVVADGWLREITRRSIPADEAFVAGRLSALQDDDRAAQRRQWRAVWARAAAPKRRRWFTR